jgi:hypothetical protein
VLGGTWEDGLSLGCCIWGLVCAAHILLASPIAWVCQAILLKSAPGSGTEGFCLGLCHTLWRAIPAVLPCVSCLGRPVVAGRLLLRG